MKFVNPITIECQCPFCRKIEYIEVEEDDYLAWENGALAQNVFFYLSADDREMLISGICPTCWDKMFGGVEE